MKMPKLSFDTVSDSNVVILGAGPSINSNLETIKKFRDENDAVVIGASRKYPVHVDYTLFVDEVQYSKFIEKLDSPHVIVPKWCPVKSSHRRKHKYLLLPAPQFPVVYDIPKITMNKENSFDHGLGNSGFASILISPFFRPQKLLIVGFDGPAKNYKEQIKFDGTKGKYSKGKQKRLKSVKQPFVQSKVMWSYLQGYNIEVFSVDNDAVWGLNKDKNNVKIYK